MAIDRAPSLSAFLWLFCCLLCQAAAPASALAQETFTDKNNTCTMKLTPRDEGQYLIGIICEQRKILSYWDCTEPERTNFSPYTCLEKETQYVDPVNGVQKQTRDREMRIYATEIKRVPYVLCGRVCDPSR